MSLPDCMLDLSDAFAGSMPVTANFSKFGVFNGNQDYDNEQWIAVSTHLSHAQ